MQGSLRILQTRANGPEIRSTGSSEGPLEERGDTREASESAETDQPQSEQPPAENVEEKVIQRLWL